MVFLKGLFSAKKATIMLLCFVVAAAFIIEVKGTKIAYTKSLNGKTHIIKTKSLKHKAAIEEESYFAAATPTKTTSTTPTTTTTTTSKPYVEESTEDLTSLLENLEFAESSHASKTITNAEEEKQKDEESTRDAIEKPNESLVVETTDDNMDQETTKDIEEIAEPVLEIPENHIDIETVDEHPNSSSSIVVDHYPGADNITVDEISNSSENAAVAASSHITESTNSPAASTSKNAPIPCTCGVFMTSQIKRTKNPYEPPSGKPVITNELDRMFQCNAVGQKQCQTKCLEAIVQHLPNSANILCATIDRDIRKERAYLYIKNCRNSWYNTRLAAGREYCCKSGQPYQCPLV